MAFYQIKIKKLLFNVQFKEHYNSKITVIFVGVFGTWTRPKSLLGIISKLIHYINSKDEERVDGF